MGPSHGSLYQTTDLDAHARRGEQLDQPQRRRRSQDAGFEAHEVGGLLLDYPLYSLRGRGSLVEADPA